VPVPDPLPSPSASLKRRFVRIFRLCAALSVVIAILAAILVSRGDPTLHIHMVIATALGVGFTVLLGTSLMALAFLSSSTGHDERASHSHQENDER
jgi:peptidoglycan/LPS O-acetylase OafA/YrhL